MSRPPLILLASGDQCYRGYMLERLAQRFAILLLATDPISWEEPYIESSLPVTAGDERGIMTQALALAQRSGADGVLTYHEPCVRIAAEIAERLQLPHCPLPAAAACRDKYLAHTAFVTHGVPVARSRLTWSAEEAVEVARSVGWPVIVKPRALSASFGVTLAASETQVREAFCYADSLSLPEPWTHARGVLVEEYLQGPEISVDSIVHGGRVEPLVFARKFIGQPPHFEETAHMVGPADQVVDNPHEISTILVQAHAALGLDDIATHSEIKLTPQGPKIVEINGRTGGDLIPLLGELALGVDLVTAGAQVATGRPPDTSMPRAGAAAVHFVYADRSGPIRHPRWPDPPDWVNRIDWFLPEGKQIDIDPGRRYFSRLGCAIIEGRSLAECRRRLQEAVSALG